MDAPAPRRLAGGRSNRVWRAGGVVVKLFSKVQDNPLFANDPAREAAALRALGGTGMVPQLIASGQFEGHAWLAYSHITGASWRSDAAHVAQLLGRLHDQPPFAGLPPGANGSAALEAQARAILNRCRQPGEVLRLRPLGQVQPLPDTQLIHGDPVPGNLVAHDGTLTLIDWQCPQLGDPAEDLALFTSPAMQLLYRGSPLARAEEDAFLAAYPDRRITGRMLALKPWYHWRMAAYCLWQAERGGARDRDALQLELAALQSISPNRA
ncbi:phosphotransferase family protein [Roseobacteraceae bacterium NS-SX3]